jgi:hypothetical protein
MAGHRRRARKTDPDADLAPLQKVSREQRRLAYLQTRLDAAGEDPAARLTAAVAYLRGVVARADAGTAARISRQFEAAVIETGTRLFASRRDEDQQHDLGGFDEYASR